jgi:hypothetical protein
MVVIGALPVAESIFRSLSSLFVFTLYPYQLIDLLTVFVIGETGIEPVNASAKGWCLTVWLLPTDERRVYGILLRIPFSLS